MAQVGHGNGQRKKRKTGRSCSYQTAQVGHGDGRGKKSKTGEDGSYTQLRLAMETEKERRARLENQSANHHRRLVVKDKNIFNLFIFLKISTWMYSF